MSRPVATDQPGSIFDRLDRLNEFERQPVSDENLCGGGYFAGSFAGEHVAATEFVIGALFVIWGASAFDVMIGLLLGNLLAVLSWTLVCAPIAVQTRLTLYWYLRQVGGPVVMVVYNVLNAVLYCILAGCMITVAASAVRIPLGIRPQTGWLPTDPWFVPVVVAVGAVVVTLAVLGFKRLAQFASICSPWMLLMFVAGAFTLLPQLGTVRDGSSFWKVANEKIWAGDPPAYRSMSRQGDKIVLHFDRSSSRLASVRGAPLAGFAVTSQHKKEGDAKDKREFVAAEARIEGQTVVVSCLKVDHPVAVRYEWPEGPDGMLCNEKLLPVSPFVTDVAAAGSGIGFWHIVAFAWICNLAMHLGLSDMALFRYARRSSYGLYSAFGMYLGHYAAWICAGIMGAAAARLSLVPLVCLDSGEVAFVALGWLGALAVVIAGWTTSNPTLYRAGLALQVVTPGWPRWLVTLIAGAVTTVIACFPFVFRHLLDFVGIYGLLLMPVGAIVVVEHWVFPRIGLARFWASRKGLLLNWPALLAWAVSLSAAVVCWQTELVHLFFLCVPVWLLTAVLYIALAAMAGARESLPELPAETPAVSSPPAAACPGKVPRNAKLYYVSGTVALACLAACLVLPISVFAGRLQPDRLKTILIWVTLVYFVSGVTWMKQRDGRKPQSAE